MSALASTWQTFFSFDRPGRIVCVGLNYHDQLSIEEARGVGRGKMTNISRESRSRRDARSRRSAAPSLRLFPRPSR